MTYRSILCAGAAVLAVSAPAHGQTQEGQQQGQGQGQELTIDVVPATQWNYEGLDRGWSADELLEDAEIYNEEGEEIGELEDLVMSPDGTVRHLVIESGGFLDIGDATFAYPIDRATIEGPERIVVQIPAGTEIGEDYSLFAGEQFDEDAPAPGDAWRLSQLLNDYAYLGGGVPYGWVRDVVINPETLSVDAVVVSPDVGYGAPGLYAFPYYDWRGVYNPQTDVYQVPYTAEEIGALQLYVAPRAQQGEGMGEGMSETDEADQG